MNSKDVKLLSISIIILNATLLLGLIMIDDLYDKIEVLEQIIMQNDNE